MTGEQAVLGPRVSTSRSSGPARARSALRWHLHQEAFASLDLTPWQTPSLSGVERRIDGKEYRFAHAHSSKQRDLARELVVRRYAWRGYDVEGALGSGVSAGDATFLAQCGERVDGTLTVRIDSRAGLLADQLYPDEIAQLRRKGARLCEFGRLAFDEGINTLEILGPLFHLGMAHARWYHACTDMVIEVNPRHVGFYRRVGGMEVLGEVRTCDRVAAPAVLLRLSLERAVFWADEQGGERTGYKSIYPFCFGRTEMAAVRRELALLDIGMDRSEDRAERTYALL